MGALLNKCPARIIFEPVPTIDLPDDELAAVAVAIRGVIEEATAILMRRALTRCAPRWRGSRRRQP